MKKPTKKELLLDIHRVLRQENPDERVVMQLLKQVRDFTESHPRALTFEPDPYWSHDGSPQGIDAALRRVRFRYEQKKTGRGLRPVR